MSIEALILEKLHEDAKTRTSSTTGRQYVTAKVRVAVSDGESVFVNVIAFSESACTALLALAGTLIPGACTDREGNAKPSVDLVASQILTVYGLKKKRDAATGHSGGDHAHDDR